MNDLTFWKLESLSDRQLLDGLGAVLGSGRRLVAELVAHLGEVEERRLHLAAACSSMFSYCVHRLGLSEDEACRRIEVARLARRCPAMFPLLAAGKLSLSVAALLKPHLSAERQLDPRDQLDLLAAVSGKSVQQAREILAARFPRPDVPSSLRKLPHRRAGQPASGTPGDLDRSASGPAPVLVAAFSMATRVDTTPPGTGTSAVAPPRIAPAAIAGPATTTTALGVKPNGSLSTASPSNGTASNTARDSGCARVTSVPEAWPGGSDPTTSTSEASSRAGSPTQRSRASRIEPLAVQRYKVQFTADAELKSKLELARDLMRHANPSGELGLIVGRALDLLIDDLMKRRFGAGARRKAPAAAKPVNAAKGSDRAKPSATAKLSDTTEHPSDAARVTTTDSARTTASDTALRPYGGATSRYVSRAVRRRVLERDGLRCSWVDAGGARCDSRAWLEHDHRQPRAKGGGAEPDNLRLLCRAHNGLAAEREYGRAHIERVVAKKRWRRAQKSRPRERPPPG